MKEIDVLGMHITDYSAVDAVKESLRYLGNGAMNSIFFVSSHILMEAGEREELKALLDKMDMLLCGEPAVLEVLGVNAPKRREEVEDEVFLRDFIKRLGRAKQKVFFVADSEEKAESLVNYATQVHENIIVAGSFVVTEDTTEEALINEINDVSPRTIISALPFEKQLHLMGEKGHLVNADVLSLTGLHLRDTTLVQEDTSHQLYAEGTLPEHSVVSLAYQSESLGQNIVQRLAIGKVALQLVCIGAQLRVGHSLEDVGESLGSVHQRYYLLYLLFTVAFEN